MKWPGQLLAGVLLASSGCTPEAPPAASEPADAEPVPAPAQANPATERRVASPAGRQALFGDLHVHTWWSFDAYSLGVRAGPEDAYRYMRGEAIDHISGEQVQMQAPALDFVALTEHAEYMGVSVLASDPASSVSQLPLIRALTSEDTVERNSALGRFAQILSGSEPIPELLTDEVVVPMWRRIVDMANANNVPGAFTAFVAYEYTSMPQGQNLHRNVIFAGDDVPPRPFSSIDSANPEDLWAWMDKNRETGSDLISIPHNANASNGLMYAASTTAGAPLDAAQAQRRARNEPISEIFQIKGQSETHPALSPDDEWAGFEQFDRILGRMTEPSQPQGSFARRALQNGLQMAADQGFNPYGFGVIGSSDGHNATSPVEESNYTGKIGIADSTPTQRLVRELSPGLPLDAVSRWGAAGLAGVWSEDNSRSAIFAALRRRETFATSGPRIRARFFAGWDFAPTDVAALVETGYDRGVPMGGELAGRRTGKPGFLYWALRDPNEAPLERVQIVKLWEADGIPQEQVIDIGCADGAAPTAGRCGIDSPLPDLETCAVRAPGAAELSGFWQDPDYRPDHHAAYYLRVLQVPTCRWSTYDARRLGIELPAALPATLQERAVTSAVWMMPATGG